MEENYRQVYEWGAGVLRHAGIAEAELDARLLLEYICGTNRNTLLVHGEREVTVEEYENYVNLIAERKTHKPLQYITGVQEFMGLEFAVDENVLIPRQDTEILVEEVMRHLHDGMRILDMCTGSGCILLSLLYYSNDCTGLGVDISDKALQTAQRNLKNVIKLKKDKKAASGIPATSDIHDTSDTPVTFLQSNLFEELAQQEDYAGAFDIIVSNPPYIESGVIDTLMPEVREYEPRIALDGRTDGLYFYRRIIEEAGTYLSGGGELFLEIGSNQGCAVSALMEEAGYQEIEVVKDFAGLDRVVHGTLV